VVTDCLLVSAGFSFHDCVTKQHHVPIFGIFPPVWLVAKCVERVGVLCIEPKGPVQAGVLGGGVDDNGVSDPGWRSHLVERPG